MTARAKSALAQLRRDTQQRYLRPPPELRVDPTLPGAGSSSAYCPLLHEWNGSRVCGDVDCGRCDLLRQTVDELEVAHAWVCSSCAAAWRALPFWKDGACDVCGYDSSVLMLVVPRAETVDEPR